MDFPVLQVLNLIEKHVEWRTRRPFEHLLKAAYQGLDGQARVDRRLEREIQNVSTADVRFVHEPLDGVKDHDCLSHTSRSEEYHGTVHAPFVHQSRKTGQIGPSRKRPIFRVDPLPSLPPGIIQPKPKFYFFISDLTHYLQITSSC